MPARMGALPGSRAKCGLMSATSTVRETNGVFSSLANSMAENAMEGKCRPSTAKLGMTLRVHFMRCSWREWKKRRHSDLWKPIAANPRQVPYKVAPDSDIHSLELAPK